MKGLLRFAVVALSVVVSLAAGVLALLAIPPLETAPGFREGTNVQILGFDHVFNKPCAWDALARTAMGRCVALAFLPTEQRRPCAQWPCASRERRFAEGR